MVNVCGICKKGKISLWSVLHANYFNPHVCEYCNAKSYVKPIYQMWHMFLSSIFFWPLLFVLYYFSLTYWLLIVVVPFSLYLASFIAFKGNSCRSYKEINGVIL